MSIRRLALSDLESSRVLYDGLVALQESDPVATPFQHPAFLLNWWHTVGRFVPGLDGFLLVASDARERAIWYLPVMIDTGGGQRILKYLGDPYSDYHTLVCDPAGSRAQALAELQEYLLAARDWDTVRLDEWRDARSAHVFDPARWAVTAGTTCPFLDLTSEAGVARAVSKREYVVKSRRLARIGEVRLRVDAGHGHLDRFIAMHRTQWEGRDSVGGFDDPAVERFFRGMSGSPALEPLVHLFALTLDSVAIAYYFCFIKGSVCYGYRTAYDVELRRFSPGSLLLVSMIENLSDRGVTEFDFMRGGYSYKERFASGLRHNCRIATSRRDEVQR